MKLEIKNLSKKFKDVYVLKDINLTFESGKIYGFTGRNGSGKSVLLKIICGFYTPTSGEGLLDNYNYILNNDFPKSTRCLIEKPNFLPDLTGYENLKLLASIENKIGNKEIMDTIEKLNLKEEINKEEFILSKLSKREVKDIELKNDILVSGIDNIKVSLANCCKPVKGDKIVGYISRGNGVIVHTKNCYNLRHMDDRIIDVSWNKEQVQKYKTNISIVSEKLENVLLDIITKTNNLNISITKVDTKQKEN